MRVGVIGAGYWGSKHIRVLCNMENVESVVAIDSRPHRLAALTRSFPAVKAFCSLDDALGHIDALVVATPPSTHATIALEALSAGKHTLVEKPLATSVEAAQGLVDAADAAGVVLMVGHTFEHNAAVWKLRELVQSGELGHVYYIDTGRLNLGLYQTDVNVIWDLAPHDVSIVNLLLSRPPSAVQAWASRHAHHRFEDVAYLRLVYDELDVQANIHVSWLDPCKVRRVTVVGSKKMAVYNDLAAEERIRIHDKGVSCPPNGHDLTQPPTSYRYGDITVPFVPAQEPLAVEDEHFVECAFTGATPKTDGLNGLAVVQVLECAERSLMAGRPVRLSEGADLVASNA
jgi:predicted dehydrogenase